VHNSRRQPFVQWTIGQMRFRTISLRGRCSWCSGCGEERHNGLSKPHASAQDIRRRP
jgi:hypothetical protein